MTMRKFVKVWLPIDDISADKVKRDVVSVVNNYSDICIVTGIEEQINNNYKWVRSEMKLEIE